MAVTFIEMSYMLKDFNGRKVFITGGAKRLGAEIAKAFAGYGAELIIHHNNSARDAERLVKEMLKKGAKAYAVKADVGKIGEIEDAVNKGAELLGGLDILIVNAAIFYKTPLAETSESQWNDFMDINLRAPFFFSKFASPFLKKSSCGRIINISDTCGFSPAASYVPYGVSKAGLIALTKGLAKELAPEVTVNCVCPGVIKMKQEAGSRKQETAVNSTLLKRPSDIKDVVDAVLFLAKNNSMTGQAVCVDGGKNV